MKTRQLLLGAAAGAGAGYIAVRAYEALQATKHSRTQTSPDSAAYGRTRRALTTAGAARGLISTLGFAYGPLAPKLRRALEPLPPFLRPAAFFGGIALASALVELPVEFIEDFSLERAYGLSEQDVRGWLGDQVKSIAIGTAVAAVLGSLGSGAVRRFPRFWPVAASLGLLPLLVLANVVVPLYILPIYNTFEPLEGPLEVRLRALASRFGVGDAGILRMNMSRQTKKANAFVTGIGGTHRIVLGDTLVDRFEPEEIEFVVAHELGHYVTNDTWRMIAMAECSAALLFAAASRTGAARENDAALAFLRIFALLSAGFALLRPAMSGFSRSREWAADRFALAATRDARAGAAAFRRLRDQNLAEEDVPAWFELLFGSHPSLGKRIEVLERT